MTNWKPEHDELDDVLRRLLDRVPTQPACVESMALSEWTPGGSGTAVLAAHVALHSGGAVELTVGLDRPVERQVAATFLGYNERRRMRAKAVFAESPDARYRVLPDGDVQATMSLACFSRILERLDPAA